MSISLTEDICVMAWASVTLTMSTFNATFTSGYFLQVICMLLVFTLIYKIKAWAVSQSNVFMAINGWHCGIVSQLKHDSTFN